MPLTQLDAVAALIVIDLQKGIVGLPLADPDRQKMIAADVQQPDTAEAAGYADGSF